VLVVPGGMLTRLRDRRQSELGLFACEKKRVEDGAMNTVMAAERALGYEPQDVSEDNLGYDVEPLIPAEGNGRNK
jgi:hypothetical protein